MTDHLREGDQIEAVIRLTVVKSTDPNRFWDKLVVTDKDGATLTGLVPLMEIAESVTLVRPEIVPGKPYVDDEGRLYVGLTHGRVQRVDEGGRVDWFGGEGDYREGNFIPAGLRPAKVVPEP